MDMGNSYQALERKQFRKTPSCRILRSHKVHRNDTGAHDWGTIRVGPVLLPPPGRCYVGKVRLTNAIDQFKIENPEVQVRVCFSPYLVDPTIPAEGEDHVDYVARRWGNEDWTLSAQSSSVTDGVGFANWKTWPNSLLAHRLQKFSEGYDRGNEVNSLIFDTIYERGGNVSNLDTLVSIAHEAGLPEAATHRYLASREGVDTIINEDLHAKNVLNIMSAPQYVLRGASPMPGGISVPGNSGRAIVLQGAVSSLNIVQALWSAPSK